VIVCCIALFVLLTFFCSKRDWSPLNCTNHNECIKILLVSDPQIIGEKNEKVHFLTPITVWHCDNYLKKSYRKVYNFVKPDVVIFLGDLMDEGSTATDAEFKRYRGRFFNIYPKSSSSKYIWLPGDNDIGGEGNEPVNKEALKNHFYKAFPKFTNLSYSNIIFYNINGMTDRNSNSTNNEIVIGLSHTLKLKLLHNKENIVDSTRPRIVFTGHNHVANIIKWNGRHKVFEPIADNITLNYSTINPDLYYEIQVPTCSYRMGSTQIGYGYAVIGMQIVFFLNP
jgi:predicted phosphodiesterase